MGDPHGIRSLGKTALEALLDRGRRDLGLRGLACQKRATMNLSANVDLYTLPGDHVQTFAFLVAQFSTAVRLLSQDGYAWWLTVSPTGDLGFTDVQPAGNLLLNGSSVYWLQITSSDAHVWYLYPSPTGDMIVSDVQPATGPGTTQTVQLRDITGVAWYPGVSVTGDAFASMSGSATQVAPALDDRPLQLVVPEAIDHIDPPRTTTGRPRRYTIMGKILRLEPVPDVAWQLVHYYWADDVGALPDAWKHLPLLMAASMTGTMERGEGLQMLGMYNELMTAFTENWNAGVRDGLDMAHTPAR